MNKAILVSDEKVKKSLNMSEVIEGVEEAYRLKSSGEAGVFPVITHEWIQGEKDMDIKSGYVDGDIHIYGLKALTFIESNQQRNLPLLNGMLMIFDSENGQLIGFVDPRSITGVRTGAAGAIGSKYLARPDSETILLVGAGNQALNNLAGNLITMKALKNVLVYDPVCYEFAEKFVSTAKERLADLIPEFSDKTNGIEITAVRELSKACSMADIITTVTPSLKPLVMKEWVKSGTHINCIGADMAEKQEVDENLLPSAKLVSDDIVQSTSIGELEIGVKKGIITAEDIYCEIGDIISGKCPGRTSNDEITLFDTTGLALQDLIVAKILLDKAKTEGTETVEF